MAGNVLNNKVKNKAAIVLQCKSNVKRIAALIFPSRHNPQNKNIRKQKVNFTMDPNAFKFMKSDFSMTIRIASI